MNSLNNIDNDLGPENFYLEDLHYTTHKILS